MATDDHPNPQQPHGDVDAFLDGGPFAVVGASADRGKYGNKVLRVYLQNKRKVFAVNPRGGIIEGLEAYRDLASLPELPHGVSIITPPSVTEQVVDQAVQLGIKHLWMQPGAESEAAISRARESGVNVVAKGPCALVVMGFRGP